MAFHFDRQSGRTGDSGRHLLTRGAASLAILGLLVLSSACTSPADAADSRGTARAGDKGRVAERVLESGFSIIRERSLNPVPTGTVALDGLKGLSTLDPALGVERTDGRIRLKLGQKVLGEIDAPSGENPSGWAHAVTQTIALAREGSPPLAGATAEKIYKAVFDGALARVDRFSRYADRDEAREARARRDGFGGIGILFDVIDGAVVITDVLAKSPAADADLRAGDRIVAFNRQPAAGLSHDDVSEHLRGMIGSRLDIEILRPDEARPRAVTLVRELIVQPTVFVREDRDIATFRISGFNHRTAADLAERLTQVRQERGASLRGVVLDLRGNPGGLLRQAVAVADIFLSGGPILTTRGRHPDSLQAYSADAKDLAEGLPVAVLVDGGSASAAEIVAAVLQDRGRAVVIGSTSYGKGTVQTVVRLPNDGEMALTWSRLHTPSGFAWHDLGIMPNVCTSGSSTDAVQLVRTLHETYQTVARSLASWRSVPPTDQSRRAEMRTTNCPAQHDERPLDLNVAERLFAEPALYRETLFKAAAGQQSAELGDATKDE